MSTLKIGLIGCGGIVERSHLPAWMKSREPFDGPFAQRMRAEGTDEQKMLMGAIEKWER